MSLEFALGGATGVGPWWVSLGYLCIVNIAEYRMLVPEFT